MSVKPLPPRYKIENLENRMVVSVPSYKYFPFILVFGLWTLMWVGMAIGSATVIFTNVEDWNGIGIAIVWLGLVILIGAPIVYGFLWQAIGYEEVTITDSSLFIRRVVLGLKVKKEYDGRFVKDMRVSTANSAYWEYMNLSFSSNKNRLGVIAFDYGARTFRFGSGIDEAEGKQIVAEILQKYPQYKN